MKKTILLSIYNKENTIQRHTDIKFKNMRDL